MPDEIVKTRELDQTGTETLLALLQSKTNGEAARLLSISEAALYVRITKYGLRERLAQVPKDALMRLQLGSVKAAEVLVGELDSNKNKMQAATEILDRTGVVNAKSNVNVQVNNFIAEKKNEYGI